MLISWLLSTLESCCRPLLAHLLLRPGRHPIPSASTLQLWKVCFCSEERAEAPSAGRPHGHHSSEGHIPRYPPCGSQSKGVRCWFASEDMKIGDRLRPRLDETIRLYDKLLLVLSKASVASQWVEQEVETALARRTPAGHHRLVPVRIDDTVMTLETGWPALIRNTRNIGDFRRWKMHGVYQKAFDRLLRDLKAAERQP